MQADNDTNAFDTNMFDLDTKEGRIAALRDLIQNKALYMETRNVGDGPELCNCGTCKDAVEAALKWVDQSLQHDCPLWAMCVAIAASNIMLVIMSVEDGSDAVDRLGQEIKDMVGRQIIRPESLIPIAEKIMENEDD